MVVSGTRQVKPVQDVVLPADTPAVVRKLPGTSTDGQTGGDSEQLLVVTAPGVTSVVYDDGHGQRRPVPLVDGAAIVPRATDRADDKDAVLVTAAGSTTRIGVYDQRTLKTVVPDVRGLRLPAATRRLGAAGLVTGEPGHLLRACTGRRCVDDLVAVQSPPPGERITTGTSVQLTVIPGLISTSPAPPTPTTPYASGTHPVADLPSPPTTSASPAPADALVGADGLHDQPHWPRRGDEAAMRRVLVAGERSHSPVTASLAVLWSGSTPAADAVVGLLDPPGRPPQLAVATLRDGAIRVVSSHDLRDGQRVFAIQLPGDQLLVLGPPGTTEGEVDITDTGGVSPVSLKAQDGAFVISSGAGAPRRVLVSLRGGSGDVLFVGHVPVM